MPQKKGRPPFARWRLKAYAVVALGGVLAVAAGVAHAEDRRRGWYVGFDLGLADAVSSDSPLSGISHPTRCDRILYGGVRSLFPAVPGHDAFYANDPQCRVDRNPRRIYTTEFDPGIGFAGGVSAGYGLDMGLRFEAEYFYRNQSGDSSLLPAARGSAITQDKSREWAPGTPSARLSDFHGHQFFLNAYYDFLNDSRWTPYIGAGVGWAHVRARYRNHYRRISAEEGYEDVFRDVNGRALEPYVADSDIGAMADRAAGSVSSLSSGISGNLFGFQVLAGVDYALTERISVGVKGRWSRFESLSDTAVWDTIRNHGPYLSDGVTPYRVRIKLDHIEFWAVTLGMKYRF